MRIKLLEGAVMPKQATKNAACYDLYATMDVIIYPSMWEMVGTGVCFELPYGIVGTVSHRSGMNSKKGVQAYGRIDPDYRGEVHVTLYNNSLDPLMIRKGDRFAQIEFHQCWFPAFEVVNELNETKRGEGGYGSTGE
jgi:dUTP pyrophosphatase